MRSLFRRHHRDYRLYAAALVFGFTLTIAALSLGSLFGPATQDVTQVTAEATTSTSNVAFAYATQAANNIFSPIESAVSSSVPHFTGRTAPRPASMTEVVKIGKGDTLNQIFGGFNIPREIALQAIQSLGGIFSPRNFRVGQQITLLFRPTDNGAREFRGYRFSADPLRDVIVLDTKGTGEFDATIVTKELKPVIAAKQGVITSSLIGAGNRAGVPQSIMAEMIRLYSYSVDFQRDIHEGDRFEVMYEAKMDKDGRVHDTGNLVYAKLILDGEPNAIYRYDDGHGHAEFFKADGSSIRRGLIRTPIDGARITSGFGFRHHPILGYNKQHKGVDFGARIGTPIFAAGDAVVTKAGVVSGYGNYIKLTHNARLATAYAHMSRFAKGIRPGVRVKQGQVIGYVGMTGRTTGPHLHYEVLINNAQVNPVGVKVPVANQLAGRDLTKFKNYVMIQAKQFKQALNETRDGKLASR